MAVTLAALDERAAVLTVALRPVELTALPVAGRAVSLDVAQMCACRPAAGAMADDPCLHHHPPLALSRGSLGRLLLQ
jgi:hypothetical protein